MKTIKLCVALTLMVFLLHSCGESKTKTEPPKDGITNNDKRKNSSNDLLTRQEFDNMRETWEQNFRGYMDADSLHYFDVPLQDLHDILQENGLEDARFYMGMELNDNEKLEPHLILVGMDNGRPNFNIIADYSTACPPKCF